MYGASTPWTGEIEGADADWQFCGGRWLGYDFALGDFDGDGATDLAAGAPASGTAPGVVYVWTDPRRGRHEADDAALVFGSGLDTPDLFGFRVGAGDIDGDGRDDLAVGAGIRSWESMPGPSPSCSAAGCRSLSGIAEGDARLATTARSIPAGGGVLRSKVSSKPNARHQRSKREMARAAAGGPA